MCDSGCGKGACVCNNTCYCAEGYTGHRCTEKGESTYVSRMVQSRQSLPSVENNYKFMTEMKLKGKAKMS